jgi:hypothetical protein
MSINDNILQKDAESKIWFGDDVKDINGGPGPIIGKDGSIILNPSQLV